MRPLDKVDLQHVLRIVLRGFQADGVHPDMVVDVLRTLISELEPATVYDRKVADLELSVRAQGILKWAGVVTIRDLAKLGRHGIKAIDGIGKTSHAEILAELSKLGVEMNGFGRWDIPVGPVKED